jgi:hypothetical protein
MTARAGFAVLAALALSGLPGCFDSIVGAECKEGYSPCHGVCVVSGTCPLDGGGLDGAGSEISEGLDAIAEGGTPDGGQPAAIDGQEIDQAPLDGPTVVQPAIDGPAIDQLAIDGLAIDQAATDGQAIDVDAADGQGIGVGATDGEVTDSAVEGAEEGQASADATEADDVPGAADPPPQDAPWLPQNPPPTPVIDTGEDSDAAVLDGDEIDGGCAACIDSDSSEVESETFDGSAADESDSVTESDATGDTGDGSAEPDGPPVCSDNQIICDNRCASPASDPDNCGQCGNACDTRVCIGGSCLVCDSEEGVCEQRCVNLSLDPDNCGGCGKSCTNGLCSNGGCQAAGTGRIIVIGHDYLENRADMNRILGNSVFLWPQSPVRLLAYKVWANSTAIRGVEGAIDQVATATGRVYRLSRAQDESAEGIATALASTDVFLIYGQEFANNDILIRLGTTWKAALATFVQNGGTLIVLDGAYPGNTGTVQILSQDGDDGQPKLFDLTRAASATGEVCDVVARGDAIAVGAPKMYLCERNSTTFTVSDAATTITQVVAAGESAVVLDKIF